MLIIQEELWLSGMCLCSKCYAFFFQVANSCPNLLFKVKVIFFILWHFIRSLCLTFVQTLSYFKWSPECYKANRNAARGTYVLLLSFHNSVVLATAFNLSVLQFSHSRNTADGAIELARLWWGSQTMNLKIEYVSGTRNNRHSSAMVFLFFIFEFGDSVLLHYLSWPCTPGLRQPSCLSLE